MRNCFGSWGLLVSILLVSFLYIYVKNKYLHFMKKMAPSVTRAAAEKKQMLPSVMGTKPTFSFARKPST